MLGFLSVNPLVEAQPFLMAMPGLAVSQHSAIECVERGEHGGGTMAQLTLGLGAVKS
jgi:hypothetical protein